MSQQWCPAADKVTAIALAVIWLSMSTYVVNGLRQGNMHPAYCTLYLKTISEQYVSESHGMHTTLSTPVITGWRHFIVGSWQWMRDPWAITLGIVWSFRPVVTLPYRRTLIDSCNNSWRWHWFFIEHIVQRILDWVEHWICAWSDGTCSGWRLHL